MTRPFGINLMTHKHTQYNSRNYFTKPWLPMHKYLYQNSCTRVIRAVTIQNFDILIAHRFFQLFLKKSIWYRNDDVFATIDAMIILKLKRLKTNHSIKLQIWKMTHDFQFDAVHPMLRCSFIADFSLSHWPPKNLFIHTCIVLCTVYTFHCDRTNNNICVRFNEFSKLCGCQPNQQCMELEITAVEIERERKGGGTIVRSNNK